MADIKNKVASVHQQLLNRARETGRPFNELLQYYAMEKFLLRISHSPYSDEYILKGALLLRAIGIAQMRPTRDIDILGLNQTVTEVEQAIATCCKIKVKEDGLRFHPESVIGAQIREQDAYNGIRIKVQGTLGNAKVSIQIDMGFGDIVTPKPLWIEYPSILIDEKPKIRAYTLESIIAEKFHAMVNLDIANSRMKDFYDIYYLSETRSFEGSTLKKAVLKTFQRRKTEVPSDIPTALTEAFYKEESKLKQWNAFRSKISEVDIPADFDLVISQITKFLLPIVDEKNKKIK